MLSLSYVSSAMDRHLDNFLYRDPFVPIKLLSVCCVDCASIGIIERREVGP